MSNSSLLKLFIEGIAALGSFALAVLAIWGDWFRGKLARPKLVIVPHTPSGDPTTTTTNMRVMYYHLKVVNLRRWLPATNCRVLLKGLLKRGPDGLFHSIPMAVPFQFVWAPAGITPATITLVNEQILDFGVVPETGERVFTPLLYSWPNNFQGFVRPGDAIRYQLEIEATNHSTVQYQVFEVAWDGEWSFVPETMAQHLRIREIES